jgi:GAF domain
VDAGKSGVRFGARAALAAGPHRVLPRHPPTATKEPKFWSAWMLPGELSCGITMRRGRGATTMASSDTRASQVDEIQYGHDEGPCLHSLATGKVVVVDDLASDDRWGGYQLPALGHGVRSSLSLPLRTDGQVIGALNIYATEPRTFGPPEQVIAGRFADEASRALVLAVRIAERTEMSEHLQTAIHCGVRRCVRVFTDCGVTCATSGAENSVTSCDLQVLVNETADSLSPQRPNSRSGARGRPAGES